MKIFNDFFACRFVLAANHQYPRNNQRLFRLQKCLSCNSSIYRKYSKTFSPAKLSQPQIIFILEIFKDFPARKQQQPAAAINSSNQRQQSATAINSSNHQQQSATATSCSNQQKQPAAATSNSNQQQQPTFIHQPALTQSSATVRHASARLMPASDSYHYGS